MMIMMIMMIRLATTALLVIRYVATNEQWRTVTTWLKWPP